ncbi:MAG TPA: hypothetical protein VM821_06780 [Abditibacteriaceae bacterium]|nr:hypothetical protein [Abditibacteriaceae bacterium]
MNKPIVRCRCGHQVLSKEVLRTDLYERRAPGDAGREYVYVKYRCRRCKRMGEAFVAENRWDWAMLEAEPNEMTDAERDLFLDEEPITAEDILDFHCQLETFSLSDLVTMDKGLKNEETEETGSVTGVDTQPPVEPIAESSEPRANLKPIEQTPPTPRPPDDPLTKRA